MDTGKITQFLEKKFDLKEGESELYIELLRRQSGTVLSLAKATGMNRITAHGYINNLIKAGLVTQTKKGARRILVAESPEKFSTIIEEKKLELAEMERELPDILGSLKALVPSGKHKNVVDFRYFEGASAVEAIYREMARANEVYSFVNIDKFWSVFPGEKMSALLLDAFERNPKRNVWDIAVDTNFARENISQSHERYHCKFMPKSEAEYGFDILIYKDKIAILQLEKGNVFGSVITSKSLASSLILIHKTMWGLLPQP